MSNAVAQAALTSQTFPLGTIAGVVRFELLDVNDTVIATQDATVSAADPATSATFSNVAPGTYRVRAARLDGGGNALQTPLPSSPFTVSGSTTTITLVSSLVVSVQ